MKQETIRVGLWTYITVEVGATFMYLVRLVMYTIFMMSLLIFVTYNIQFKYSDFVYLLLHMGIMCYTNIVGFYIMPKICLIIYKYCMSFYFTYKSLNDNHWYRKEPKALVYKVDSSRIFANKTYGVATALSIIIASLCILVIVYTALHIDNIYVKLINELVSLVFIISIDRRIMLRITNELVGA